MLAKITCMQTYTNEAYQFKTMLYNNKILLCVIITILISLFSLSPDIYAQSDESIEIDSSLGSITNPIPGYNDLVIPFQRSSFHPIREINLKLEDVITGTEANTIVHNENRFNQTPADNQEWRIFFFNLTYISGPENDVLKASDVIWRQNFFTPSGSSLAIFDTATWSHDYRPYGIFRVELYPGGSGKVIIGLLVEKIEPPPLLRVMYNAGNSINWISLEKKYTINVAANPTAGGLVKGGGAYDYNEEVTIKATANKGYSFLNWTEGGQEVHGEEEYTFKVTEDRHLVANFSLIYTFSDVLLEHPFFTEIEALAASGITTGFPDGTFRPTANVTRMAMAAFLYRGLELEDADVEKPTFSDVPEDHPFFTEIEALAASGITTGYDDGTFRPSNNVTRMAMAAFLKRGLDLDEEYDVPDELSFTDVLLDHPFYEEIELLAASGISTGWEEDDGYEFRPGQDVTRMAMAAFLVRGLELE